MTELRHPKPNAKEVAARRAAKHDKDAFSMMMPTAKLARQRMFDERLRKVQTSSAQRICNAAMQHTTYRTGDGEVVQAERPGSMHAYTLPSRGVGT
jgi:hypothetical protein